MTTDNNEGGEKLYAGKFKTVEELEAGYKSSAVVFDENEKLKKQVGELTDAPADYINPADVTHDESRINDIKSRAKAAGMTQAQYEKFLRDDKARVDARKDAYEKTKKEVGEETLNLLQDYTKKYYPPELADGIMQTFIQNKTAREAALKHRDKLLNNQAPGMDKTPAGGGYHVSSDDIQKAYEAKENAKGQSKIKAQAHYLNLLAAKGAQEKAS